MGVCQSHAQTAHASSEKGPLMTHRWRGWLFLSLAFFKVGIPTAKSTPNITTFSPIGVTTKLVASTPAHADIILCVGVTSIGTGAAAICSDRHWKGIHSGTGACSAERMSPIAADSRADPGRLSPR